MTNLNKVLIECGFALPGSGAQWQMAFDTLQMRMRRGALEMFILDEKRGRKWGVVQDKSYGSKRDLLRMALTWHYLRGRRLRATATVPSNERSETRRPLPLAEFEA